MSNLFAGNQVYYVSGGPSDFDNFLKISNYDDLTGSQYEYIYSARHINQVLTVMPD